MGQNFDAKLFDNQTPALRKRESKFSADSLISVESVWPLFWDPVLYDYAVI